MKTEHVIDALSAYLDGEAANPDAIAAHLRECPACARRLQELRAVSCATQALSAPETDPAFVTRVMAEVREQRPERRVRLAAVWTGALATVLVVAAGLLLHVSRDTAGPRAVVPRVSQADLEAVEELLWAELARQIEADGEQALLAAGAYWTDEAQQERAAFEEAAELLRSFDESEMEEFQRLMHNNASERG